MNDTMKKKKYSLWAKVGNVAFACDSVEAAINRVGLFFENWHQSGQCKPSDVNDWNIWSNRTTKSGGRKHVANIYYGKVTES